MLKLNTSKYLLLSLDIYGLKQLNKEDGQEKIVDNSLKVEEVSISGESINPSNPQIENILHTVDNTKGNNDKTFNVTEHLPIQG